MSSIIQFPSTLAEQVNNGGSHISVELIGKNQNLDVHKMHMYIPQGFNIADSAQFGTIDLGVIKATQNIASDKSSDKPKSGDDLEALAIGALALKNLGADKMGAADATLQDKGIAFNKQTTAAFEGMAIRTFNLQFVLVASSAEEAETIRKIEHTFRKYMYPAVIGESSAILEYPPVFRIKFMQGKKINQHMPFLFDSYLQNMTTSYNNQANMFHSDGAPTDITIDLTFSEQRQLSRNDLYDDESLKTNQSKSRPASKNKYIGKLGRVI